MYTHIYEEMEDAGVYRKLEESVWMDEDGNVVTENQALGCQVTHEIIRPDMCVVGDEVGGNLSMKGDGRVGGELMLCQKGTTSQYKVSVRDRYFTLMPLTLLTGEPLMCILIIAGKRPCAMTEMGLNKFQKWQGPVMM